MAAKPETTQSPKPERRQRRWLSGLSVLLALATFSLYWVRPLKTEAITIWPSWVWAIPGLLIVWSRPRDYWKALRWPLAAWLVVTLTFSEAWRVVLPVRPGERAVRVVTLNTGGDMKGAMRELALLAPDIVLIQESSLFRDESGIIEETLGEGYDGVFGRDGSVFVRGKVLSSDEERSNFTFVHAQLANGREVDIVSLRMMAPHARASYWKRETWQSYSRHRSEHLKELEGIWNRVEEIRTGAPLVFGGDFNLVPDTGELQILGDDLVDTFRVAGRGWYATALDGMAVFRIDKIWVSNEFEPKGTWAESSEVSDHKYVVADLDWAK